MSVCRARQGVSRVALFTATPQARFEGKSPEDLTTTSNTKGSIRYLFPKLNLTPLMLDYVLGSATLLAYALHMAVALFLIHPALPLMGRFFFFMEITAHTVAFSLTTTLSPLCPLMTSFTLFNRLATSANTPLLATLGACISQTAPLMEPQPTPERKHISLPRCNALVLCCTYPTVIYCLRILHLYGHCLTFTPAAI